ncbi:MAG: PIG-L deacetylase family protein [Myxococcales bacterium]
MRKLPLLQGQDARRILFLGAHADDIEIGCGGTVLRLAAERSDLEVRWIVFSATPERLAEARASATAFLAGVPRATVVVRDYRDGYLPWSGASIKDELESVKREFVPDLIFTHYRGDLHQDHRLISDLTWNTWRNQLILEYEIPKFDGDFGSPNFFSHLSRATLQRKIDLVLQHFATQAGKQWFSADLFQAVARIRGMECVAPESVAEAFYCRKAVF